MKVLLLLATLAVSACAHTHPMSSEPEPVVTARFNAAAQTRRVTLVMTDSVERLHRGAMIDAGFVVVRVDGADLRLPLTDVQRLQFTDRRRGSRDGFLVGLVPGLILGGIAFDAAAGGLGRLACHTAEGPLIRRSDHVRDLLLFSSPQSAGGSRGVFGAALLQTGRTSYQLSLPDVLRPLTTTTRRALLQACKLRDETAL